MSSLIFAYTLFEKPTCKFALIPDQVVLKSPGVLLTAFYAITKYTVLVHCWGRICWKPKQCVIAPTKADGGRSTNLKLSICKWCPILYILMVSSSLGHLKKVVGQIVFEAVCPSTKTTKLHQNISCRPLRRSGSSAKQTQVIMFSTQRGRHLLLWKYFDHPISRC